MRIMPKRLVSLAAAGCLLAATAGAAISTGAPGTPGRGAEVLASRPAPGWLAGGTAPQPLTTALQPAASRDEQRVQEWSAGGTTVVSVRDDRAPLVHVTVEFPAGTFSPWFREAHAEEAFEIQMWDPDGALRKRADQLALDIGLHADERHCSLSFACLTADLDASVRLVRDILANDRFDRRELDRRRKSREIGWKTSLKDPHFMLRQAQARLLFQPGDPRRLPYERPQPLVTDAAKLAAARDALIRLPGRVVGFAGNVSAERARQIAADLLPPVVEARPAGLRPSFGPATRGQDRPRAQAVRMPRLTQVYFAYSRESLAATDPAYPASIIADHELGGHFYSRLVTALRHEGGETYGARVMSPRDVEPGAYALATFTRADNAAVAEQKLRGVLETFFEKGITEEERASAAGFIKGRRIFARQAPEQILYERLLEIRMGLPKGFTEASVGKAASLSIEEINAFIRTFHDPARFTMLTVEPERMPAPRQPPRSSPAPGP